MIMAIKQWTQDLETGIREIDEQHKLIIGYINKVNDAARPGNEAQLAEVLEGLLEFTITHFDLEEELMEKAGYPFLKAHKMMHETLMKRLADIRTRAINKENIIPELQTFLESYLTNHVINSDHDYVESANKILIDEAS
jgi:hemerythrin